MSIYYIGIIFWNEMLLALCFLPIIEIIFHCNQNNFDVTRLKRFMHIDVYKSLSVVWVASSFFVFVFRLRPQSTSITTNKKEIIISNRKVCKTIFYAFWKTSNIMGYKVVFGGCLAWRLSDTTWLCAQTFYLC